MLCSCFFWWVQMIYLVWSACFELWSMLALLYSILLPLGRFLFLHDVILMMRLIYCLYVCCTTETDVSEKQKTLEIMRRFSEQYAKRWVWKEIIYVCLYNCMFVCVCVRDCDSLLICMKKQAKALNVYTQIFSLPSSVTPETALGDRQQ